MNINNEIVIFDDEIDENSDIEDTNEEIKYENMVENRRKRIRKRAPCSSKYILSLKHIEEDVESVDFIKALRAIDSYKIIGYRCKWSECVFASPKQYIVESHIRAKHTNYRPFKCNECDSCFVNTAGLKAHKLVVHSKHRFTCDFPECQYVGKTLDQLKAHKVSHLEVKPFLCEYPDCGHRTRKKSRLNEHMRQIHLKYKDERRYTCDWPGCDKVFGTQRGKTAHNRIHTNEKPYACVWPGCDYRTNDWSHLRRHKKRHVKTMDNSVIEERKFVCNWPECSKKFATKWNLKTHLRVHSGERPFKCEWPDCQRMFSEKGNMIKHLNTHLIKKKSKQK